jgi:hypothetical protein
MSDVVRGFGGEVGPASLSTFVEAFNDFPAPSSALLVDEVDGGVLVAENNGWHGTSMDLLQRLSGRGRAASLYRSVNADMAFSYAANGTDVCSFDPLLDEVPAALQGIAVEDHLGDHPVASSLSLIAALTGVRLTSAWLDEPHARLAAPPLV